ncbi:hypothetical protein, partial [Paraburkholderia sp. NMBU_R16]|uniref:hypothetical protein n=1 Tax=Paraburkholderia sp. NMBU_R16 TaxID=2698676 RepID=UPI001C253D25
RFSTLPAPVGNVERAFFVFAIIDVLRFNSHRFYSSSLMRQSPALCPTARSNDRFRIQISGLGRDAADF